MTLRDSVTGEHIEILDPRCAACGETEKLVLDHDRWFPLLEGGYRCRVLCQGCNHKKGPRMWVSFGDGTCWVPGMPVGMRIQNHFLRPTPAGYAQRNRLLFQNSRAIEVAGHI